MIIVHWEPHPCTAFDRTNKGFPYVFPTAGSDEVADIFTLS